MTKKKNYLILFFIFILAFFAGNFCYPKYFNQIADNINNLKIPFFNFQTTLPHFWEKPFKLGLDLQGGVHLLYQADLSQIQTKEKKNSMEGLRDIIEKRVNFFGVQEPVVQIQNERLIVELAGIIDPSQAIKEIGKTPFLEFKEQKPEEIIKKIQEKRKELEEKKTMEEIQMIPDWQIGLEDPFQSTSLTGKYLKKAELVFDQTTYKPLVSLEFDEEGTKIFEELTEKNLKKPLVIFIDGNLISSPIVQEKISGGRAQISGNFSIDEAKELARNLNAGALPVPIKLISQESVGPILGKISLEKSLKAGIYGFLVVVLFMILFYRLPGILASLALTIYIALVLSLFKLLSITLTLAGIAGFILSIGMAVDANILIFSRMKEEMKEKKDFAIVLKQGLERAWSSIRDSNLNTLIVSAILFSFGTSFVKGFAFTLILGVLVSMFSAIVITHSFLKCFEKAKLAKINWLWK